MNTFPHRSISLNFLLYSFFLATFALFFSPQTISAKEGDSKISWNPLGGYSFLSKGQNLLAEGTQDALRLLNKGRYAEERGKKKSALRAYKKVFNKYPQSIFAPEAHYRSAQIYLSQRKEIEAFDAYYVILRGYPKYGDFDTLLGDSFNIANDLINGKGQAALWGLIHIPKRRSGIIRFEMFIQAAPYSDYSALALMKIAKGHIDKKNYPLAIEALDRLINAYPNSLVTSDAYLELAASYLKLVDGPLYDQGSTKEAITYFEDFLALFPDNPDIKRAEDGHSESKELLAQSRYEIALFYDKKHHNYVAAKVLYNDAITISPNSKTAEEARERLKLVEPKVAEQEARRAKRLEERSEQFKNPTTKKKRFFGLF